MRLLSAALVSAALLGTTGAALAAEAGATPPRMSWSFAGPFGTFDRAQLQRGFQVYKEVCSTCHGLKYVAFRNLAQPGGPGFSEAQARVIAAEYQITDGPDATGEMFQRPGRLSDHFPNPAPNDQALRSRFGGALPPDLSLITKARSYESGLFPDLEYSFKHALTHEVTYGGLLADRRRALHAAVVETMEGVYAGRLAEHVEQLANHALRGEVWDKAVTYFRQAGAKAAVRSAYREAVTCFEQALAALPRLPGTHERLEEAIDLRFDHTEPGTDQRSVLGKF